MNAVPYILCIINQGRPKTLRNCVAPCPSITKKDERKIQKSLSLQAVLQGARGRLDDQKSAARERNKELQRCDSERREREKEKAGQMLAVKEVEHRLAKFQKNSRDAAAKVCLSTAFIHITHSLDTLDTRICTHTHTHTHTHTQNSLRLGPMCVCCIYYNQLTFVSIQL